ncbi:MAG TPA: ATP-binding protein, partial [Flavisolibacter sp.]|nr:ATP-binding protein [Flavisolibacter sp.]
EELHQFHSIISHDLQEPLRKLHLFADLLHSHKCEATGEVLRKVTQQANRVRGLLLGLQEYVQLDNKALKLSPLELNAVVLMAKQKLLQQYPAAQLELELSSLPRVEGDLNQLVLLFYHLLENSFKFRSAAALRVRVEGVILHQNQFKELKDQYQYTHHVKISYTDNGIGFDPKYHDHIFQLLKKVNRETEGQGVGLTICKKIVTNHKGSIEAIGEEGKGACFTIFLPLQHALLPQSEKASLSAFG